MKENADLKGVVNSLRADSADLTDEVVNLTEISSGTNQSIKNLLSVFTRNATTTQVSSKKTEKKSAQAALKTERQTAEVSARAEQANEEGQGNLVGGFQTLSKEFEVGNKLRAAGGMISQKLLSNSTLMLFNSIRQYAGDLRERRAKLKEQRETEGRTTGFLENIALVGGMSIDRLDTLQSVFAKGAIERSEMKFQNKEIISINKERQKLASETKEAITGVLNEISDLKNQSENASGKTLDNLRKQIQLKQDEVRERRAAARLEQIRLKEAAQEAKKKAGLAGAKKPATPRQPTNLLSRILDPIVNLIKRNPLIGGGGLLAVGGIMMTCV
jgi:ribosomal protein L12E/L44/L45/RPP1/RPP2